MEQKINVNGNENEDGNGKNRHHLAEINDISELTTLRDMYKKDWPENYITYYSLDNCIRLSEAASSSSAPSTSSDGNDNSSASGRQQQRYFTVYSVDGDFSDGTFILFDNDEEQSNKILFNSLSDNYDRLMKGLELLDPSRLWYFPSCTKKLKSVVDLYSIRNQCKYEIDGPTIWYYLPKETAIKFQVPVRKDVDLKNLTEKDASTVNEIWPFRYPNSINFVKRLIKNDYSVGAFDSFSGELMAWVLRCPLGGLGMLQVKETHYRKGLGRLVVIALSKRLAEDGHDVAAAVLTKNNPSRSLFKGLGFAEDCELFWLKRNEEDVVV